MSIIKIKEVNSIIVSEVLLSTYGLDILRYNLDEIKYLIELLNIVKPKLSKLTEKANENLINQK
ncbi:hypothetical protein M0R04_14375 [Candidatus Dojkabacteria bacterium]|jgi:hypothetical protein|nr:hypothetical protein [Candidatus Dojkabacteria bacterium]